MPTNRSNRFAYVEPPKALDSRIESHKKYSNFDLHQWMRERFKLRSGAHVFDIGCGNGNFTSLFWQAVGPTGTVFSMDKNPALIQEARARHAALPADRIFFEIGNFDDPFPVPAALRPTVEGKVEWAFSIYSLYYAGNCARLIEEVKRYLAPGGCFVVIGPGAENALDLVRINERLTGRRPNREYFERLERIAKEFKPLFEKAFSPANVTFQSLDSLMNFPTAQSFADYYWSTLLWREGVEGFSTEKIDEVKRQTLEWAGRERPVSIQKQLNCLVGVKH